MEGRLDQSCKLLLDRLLPVEQKNALAKLVQLLQLGAIHLRFASMTVDLVREAAYE